MKRREKILLKNSNPELLEEWDHTRNSDIDLETISRGSSKKVWWICKKDSRHKWETYIKNRAKQGAGCLYCAHKLVLKEESFGVLFPELMKEWDYSKNNNIDPFKLLTKSNKQVSWTCENDPPHSWTAPIYRRTLYKHGCKQCYNLKRPKKRINKKFLTVDYPHIAKLWDYDRNLDIDIDQITHGSARRVWWKCTNEPTHTWESSVDNQTSKNKGCPYCSEAKPSTKNSLLSIHPDVAEEWHHEKNSPLEPQNVTRASGKKVWWICKYDPEHEWQAVIRNRTIKKSSCPICNEEMRPLRLRGGDFLKIDGDISTHYKIFSKSIYSIKSIAESMKSNFKSQSKPLYRLLYSSVITSLETYLADLFKDQVLSNSEKLDLLFINANELNSKKYSVEEAITFQNKKSKIAESYIQGIIWHNIAKAGNLYKKVLKISFATAFIPEISQLVSIRHDIVHRNGRNKDGTLHPIDSESLEKAVTQVAEFIGSIEIQSQKN